MSHEPQRQPAPHANDAPRFHGPRFDELRALVAGYAGLLPRGLATSDGAVSVLGALWLAAIGPSAHPVDLLEMTPAQAAEEIAATSDLGLPPILLQKLCDATAQASSPREARTFALVELDLLEAFWEGIRVGVVARPGAPGAAPAAPMLPDPDALIVHVIRRPPRRDAA